MTMIQTNGSEQGDVIAELARLRAENATLKAKAAARATARLSCKVGEKGNVSVYGLGRFPVSLYLSQWEALLNFAPMVREFIEDNRHLLATKD